MSIFSGSSDKTRLRKDRTGMNPFTAGAVVLVIAVIAVYFGFTKHIPFTHGYRIKGVFTSAVSIRKNSPVRIAGVNVGKVTGVSRYKDSDASVVSMELQDKALPIHKDATMKIRPRIFLEGNFFVDLRPGTPTSPTLHGGSTIGITQTATPVQLDEVLTSLQSDARADLQEVLQAYGGSLTRKPTAQDDTQQDPDVQGLTAAQALNKTFNYSPAALKNSTIVNQAFLGSSPNDLSKLIASFGKVAGALDRNESALQGFITNFNVTTGALAAQQGNLSATIRLLAPTLANASRTFDALNRAFPPTRAFALEILPGVRETPATIDASFPWIAQSRAWLSKNELGTLAPLLSQTTPSLAKLTDATVQLLPQVDLVSKCVTNVILPTGDIVINDGGASNPNLHTGVANYKEFWYTMVGLAGEGQNFDGNGMYVRFQPGGGPFTVSTGPSTLSGQQLFGNAVSPPLGTRPKYGKEPPFNPNVACFKSQIPDLNGPAAEIGPAETVRSRNAPTLSRSPQVQGAVPRASGTEGQAGGQGASGQSQGSSGQRKGSTGQSQPSLTDEIVSRLNPFASAGKGGKP
jgi:phospholipid/cholesterol/gamma-HCH transport system substrate-binding protein